MTADSDGKGIHLPQKEMVGCFNITASLDHLNYDCIVGAGSVHVREAVFSPNPMWYRPIWSCDFRCNLNGLQSSGIGESLSLAFSRQLPHGGTLAAWDYVLSALVRDVI